VKTSVEKTTPTHAKISIAVSPEEFGPALEKAYTQIGSEVTIPGFRKGHVPHPVIDQRFGRATVVDQAVNSSLDDFYRSAVTENKLNPLGRPSADVKQLPDLATLAGDLVIEVEVDVRPEFALPDLGDIEVTVDSAELTDADLDTELDQLRARFGTLTTVDRPAKTGDFVSLDLRASIDGEEIDTAKDVSYEIGSGKMLDGLDEALDTLTAGEQTTFVSKLVGGDHEGEDAQVEVTLNAVKERELPELDDDFAQLASEFDTVDELKESLRGEVADRKRHAQLAQARGKLVESLLEHVDIPLPSKVVDDEIEARLNNEGKSGDEKLAAEYRPDAERALRTQLLLDDIAEDSTAQVTQADLTNYVMQTAMSYGIDPNEFIKLLSEQNQLPALFSEVARDKALTELLREVTVKDTDGADVDLTDLLPKTAEEQSAEAATEAAKTADAATDSAE
jgi:trigger factor